MATPTTPRLRLTVIGVLVICLFSALFTRLWYLQVLGTDTFVELARRNEIKVLCEPAPRGLIHDRNGEVLVGNRVMTAVTVSRSTVEDHPGVLPRLSALLEIPVPDLEKRLADPRYEPLAPVPIAVDVATEDLMLIRERSDDFIGVDATPVAERIYPYGRLASHVLGYAGPITEKELEQNQKPQSREDGVVDPYAECDNYRKNDEIGKTGAEKGFEAYLRGRPGVLLLEVDRTGKELGRSRIREPQQGADVILSIDNKVQFEAEESLRQGLEKARTLRFSDTDPTFLRAPGGATVVTDVRTGAVLAMASYPDYNPEDFIGGISQEQYDSYSNDPARPLNNRAIQGLYPPASTFKLPVAVAALTKGVLSGPQETIIDTGSYRVNSCEGPGCVFRNAQGAAYGRVNLPTAITVSSDVFFYDMGARFWEGRDKFGVTGIQDVARAFGYGKANGVGLPFEREGLVGDPNVRKQLHEARPEVFKDARWFPGDNVVMAIGQGETAATPLQLANQYGTFANGGTLYQAHIADRVLNPDGSVAQVFGPVTRATTVIPPEIRDPIVQGLRGVVASGYGTANGAFRGYRGQPVAGKTGTAQRTGEQDTALFCGFMPFQDPQYAVSVVLEEGGFGGTTAAPVARRIFEHLSGQPPGEISVGDGKD